MTVNSGRVFVAGRTATTVCKSHVILYTLGGSLAGWSRAGQDESPNLDRRLVPYNACTAASRLITDRSQRAAITTLTVAD